MRARSLVYPVSAFAIVVMSSACAALGPSSADEDAKQTSEALIRPGGIPCPPVVPEQSLVVTDPAVLAKFTFERVLTQIVNRASIPGLTPLALYQQWWDTQNDQVHAVGSGPHCDDAQTNGHASINGFPIDCARQEGALARTNPFGADDNGYHPVALFNRFDLAPLDGSNCGEYRVVFAKNSGSSNFTNRNFIIFEAVLPNPSPPTTPSADPNVNLASCRPVAAFWQSLSAAPANGVDPVAALDNFYFTGLSGFDPVIDPGHYGMGISTGGYGPPATAVRRGQIRANMFMNSVANTDSNGNNPVRGQDWELREFQLIKTCRTIILPRPLPSTEAVTASPTDEMVLPHPIDPLPPIRRVICSMAMNDVTVKANPFGALFDASSAQTLGPQFRTAFLDSVGALAATDVTQIALTTADTFNAGQSDEQAGENNYLSQFFQGGGAGTSFGQSITAKLTSLGSPLAAQDIVARAETQSCAGCHEFSNNASLGGGLTWPSSLGFVQVDEHSNLSPALHDVFLPHRQRVLQTFVAGGVCGLRPSPFPPFTSPLGATTPAGAPPASDQTTLGGGSSH